MPAYNNYFPTGYQPMNYPSYQTPTYNNGIVWVQGEAGAKAYPVASNNSVLLMDSESEKFYIKTTDASGMPMPLRVFSYKEVTGSPESTSKSSFDPSLYVTKDELESRLEALKTPSRRVRTDD